MNPRCFRHAWFGLFVSYAGLAVAQSDAAIGKILQDRVDQYKKSVGIAAGLLEAQYPPAKLVPPVECKVVKVDPAIFAGYVGEYDLAPNFIITVTTEGEGLFIQATGQPKVEVFPESETKFFLVDAQITFVKDDKGQPTHLVLHQGGANPQAKKIK